MKTSVAMCTYNGEKYIKAQLESILNQTINIDEIIICDDGSNDNTIELISKFQAENPNKISLYSNPINLGSNKNFEKAISICSGDYIFLSDQDDIWKENKVEKIIEYFLANPSTEAVFTNGDLINDKNEKISTHTLWDSVFFIENKLERPINLFKLMSSKRNMVTGATLCIKKETKDFIFPFPDFKKYYHDEWIAIIIASRKKLDYVTDELISYRIHSDQQIGGKNNIQKSTSQKHLKLSNYILGNATPKSYQDFNQLSKTYYRNYLKFKNVSENTGGNNPVNFKEIAETNLELFKKCDDSLKKTSPIFYFFRSLTDKIRGKRQLN
ncbi:glycosyltransferase family 2 protein [Flavobacterium aestivum]|uniref:glycosyltransferase family 2 protein n=1 Tax=Flavobacterium aestivum TaxID=3003257 RepID=UPI002482B576|nr:glycosyltransferase family 2 protein [Flavobacterium aestivum]